MNYLIHFLVFSEYKLFAAFNFISVAIAQSGGSSFMQALFLHTKGFKLVLAALTFVPVLLTIGPQALASRIKSATVSPSCNGYIVAVNGQNLRISGVTWQVNYSIVITESDGSTFTVSDSIPVTPDANLNFNTTVRKAAVPATEGISFSGTASLVNSNGDTFNTVNIVFPARHFGL